MAILAMRLTGVSPGEFPGLSRGKMPPRRMAGRPCHALSADGLHGNIPPGAGLNVHGPASRGPTVTRTGSTGMVECVMRTPSRLAARMRRRLCGGDGLGRGGRAAAHGAGIQAGHGAGTKAGGRASSRAAAAPAPGVRVWTSDVVSDEQAAGAAGTQHPVLIVAAATARSPARWWWIPPAQSKA